MFLPVAVFAFAPAATSSSMLMVRLLLYRLDDLPVVTTLYFDDVATSPTITIAPFHLYLCKYVAHSQLSTLMNCPSLLRCVQEKSL